MKKELTIMLTGVVMLSSCGTNSGEGALLGAQFGSVIGSAIGGISGGFRGSDIGTLVGMAGGAVVGGVIGDQVDRQERKEYEAHRRQATKASRQQRVPTRSAEDSAYYDPQGGGDDVIEDFTLESAPATNPQETPGAGADELSLDQLRGASVLMNQPLRVSHPDFANAAQDATLCAGEMAQVSFEVYNLSREQLSNLVPVVVETSGNALIAVSPSVTVEKLLPGKGVRYTAMVKGGRKLQAGEATFRLYVTTADGRVLSDEATISVRTVHKR